MDEYFAPAQQQRKKPAARASSKKQKTILRDSLAYNICRTSSKPKGRCGGLAHSCGLTVLAVPAAPCDSNWWDVSSPFRCWRGSRLAHGAVLVKLMRPVASVLVYLRALKCLVGDLPCFRCFSGIENATEGNFARFSDSYTAQSTVFGAAARVASTAAADRDARLIGIACTGHFCIDASKRRDLRSSGNVCHGVQAIDVWIHSVCTFHAAVRSTLYLDTRTFVDVSYL